MNKGEEILNEINHNSEMSLLQSEKIANSVDNLEPIMEGVLVKTDELLNEQKKTNELLTKEKSDEETKLQTVADEMTVTIRGLKGDAGEDGYTPVKGEDYFTESEIAEFKLEVTPVKGVDYVDGKDGYTPIKGVDYKDGEKGEDGKTPIAGVDFPLPKDGKNGKQGPRGPKGNNGSPDTGEEIKTKLEALEKGLNYDSLYNKPNIEEYVQRIKTSSRDYDLKELKDVLITSPTNAQVLKYNSSTGKWENGTGGGGGGGTWGSITGTLSDQTDLQSALNAKQDVVSVINGLTKTGSEIKLGGILTEDTTITGGLFSWILSALNISLLATNSAQLLGQNTSIGGSTTLKIKTPDIYNASSASGRYLKLVDDTTGEVEYDTPTGGAWGSITGTLSSQTDLQNALDDKEDVANKSTSVATDQASDTKYPSVKSVYDWATGLFQTLANLSTDLTASATKYPSVNAVNTGLSAKEDVSNKSTTTTLGTSDTLYPTQNAVKTYVDNAWIVQPINAQTGTTYTFVLSDAGKLVTGSNASAITFTVPPNSSVAFAVGTHIDITQTGAGVLSIAPGSGVTINSQDSNRKIFAQYVSATLIKTATDTWLLVGNLRA